MDCSEMVNFIRPDLPDESGDLKKIIDIDSPFILPGFIVGDDPGSSYTEDLVFLFVEKPVEKGPVLPGCPNNNCSWHFLSSFSLFDAGCNKPKPDPASLPLVTGAR